MEDYNSIDIDAIVEYILKDREKVIVKDNYELKCLSYANIKIKVKRLDGGISPNCKRGTIVIRNCDTNMEYYFRYSFGNKPFRILKCYTAENGYEIENNFNSTLLELFFPFSNIKEPSC